MPSDFFLSTSQLVEVAQAMTERIREGLKRKGAELSCLPTFVPVERLPTCGSLVVLDLGGTNIRCARVRLEGGRLAVDKGPATEKLIRSGEHRFPRSEFLDSLAALVTRVSPLPEFPLGYCFSYPAEPVPDGDAVLIRWTKELFVEETVGRKVGDMLCRRLAEAEPPLRCLRVRVINDTVATLLAGMATETADAHIGLIVGTGTNMALPLATKLIPKISEQDGQGRVLPVNLESGNFSPPHLTRWDAELDDESANPGSQRFEKAVSGRYLARLFKKRFPDTSIDPDEGAAPLFHLVFGSDGSSASFSAPEREVARCMIERSAKLVAASLAGAIFLMSGWHHIEKVSIAAEGGLFWSHPAYKETVTGTLGKVLTALGSPLNFSFCRVEHANLLGSAIAGLSRGE
jgi:hexokinase